MIVKIEKDKCIQKCVCGELRAFLYSDLKILNKYIVMPPCPECGAIEALNDNNGEDQHSLMVASIFANIAARG